VPDRLCKMFLLVLLVLSPTVYAQLSNSGIKGTVKDATGGVIPRATITLTNTGTSVAAK